MEYQTILTEAGLALEAAALAGEKSFTLSACALGDGAGEPDPKATALRNEVWRGPLHSVSRDADNPNWLVMEAHVPADDGGFIIREFGIYTDDGVLFAIGNHPETYKPTVLQGTGIEMVIRPICAVSNEASVTLLVDPAVVMASRKYVDEKMAECAASGIPTGRAIRTTAPLSGGGDLSADRTLSVAVATEEAVGVVERATDAEATAGTDTTRYVTPKHLAAVKAAAIPPTRRIATTAPLSGGGDLSADRTLSIAEATESAAGVVTRATDAQAAAGTDGTRYVTPRHLKASFAGAQQNFWFYNVSTTFTVPASGMYTIVAVGGGGGGGGGTAGNGFGGGYAGGGGGGGGIMIQNIYLSAGTEVSLSIGAGGDIQKRGKDTIINYSANEIVATGGEGGVAATDYKAGTAGAAGLGGCAGGNPSLTTGGTGGLFGYGTGGDGGYAGAASAGSGESGGINWVSKASPGHAGKSGCVAIYALS